ncbi:MAG: glycosyltransferase family 4 protein [Thermodesulfovibrionales bacterium]
MKIAYIALKGMPLGGGIEKYTEEVGSRLAARGHEVIVYVSGRRGNESGSYRGMTVKRAPSLRTRSLEKLSASLSASVMQAAEKGVDIVHFHAFGPSLFSFIPRVAGRKVVVQGHGIEWRRSKWGLMGRLFLRMAEVPSVRLPHAVTVVSDVQREYLRRRYNLDSVRIPTGVNPPEIRKPGLIRELGLEGGDYILFAARLVREKGAHYLIEAFKRLETRLKLVIAGDAAHEGSYKSELFQLASGRDNILFPGFVTGELRDELFSNCRLFVLPSEVEGLSTALLEAMSFGNCCLASDIPENLEALSGLGYTFRSGSVDDLERQLRCLTEDAGAAEAVRAPAREHVLSRYSWDSVAGQLELLYDRILNGA